ncbi:hypothetical protein LCGC14_3061110, partial [marine sediment metagenome]
SFTIFFDFNPGASYFNLFPANDFIYTKLNYDSTMSIIFAESASKKRIIITWILHANYFKSRKPSGIPVI